MPQFKYVGDPGRTYVGRGLVVEPGDEHEWPEAPDHRWEPVQAPAKETKAPLGQKESE